MFVSYAFPPGVRILVFLREGHLSRCCVSEAGVSDRCMRGQWVPGGVGGSLLWSKEAFDCLTQALLEKTGCTATGGFPS